MFRTTGIGTADLGMVEEKAPDRGIPNGAVGDPLPVHDESGPRVCVIWSKAFKISGASGK